MFKTDLSTQSKVKTIFSGVFLTGLAGYLFYQDLLIPLKTGIFYARRGKETLQDQEPVWFWVQTAFQGGFLTILLGSFGLFFLLATLRGEGKVVSFKRD
ncbi:hypothetical protein [Reinekea sp.]|jgi:hypothetical protein|uniref:hypothetical protein n=1 Tax=Reinekea sp. TaxID=1970455 RepID=UPI002A806CC5|nr:hypothetical protein [Reinekea sp.]